MAWNGSENKGAPEAPKRTANKPPSKWRGLVALVLVVAAGGLAAWLAMRPGGAEAPQAESVKRTAIAEVSPCLSTNAAAKAEEVEPATKKPKEVQWVSGMKNVAIDENGHKYYVPRPGHALVTNVVAGAKPACHIFKYSYQNELASYLTAAPGATFVGERRYSDRFVKEVVETMSLPIEDDENDSPEQRELRQKMRDVMKTLRAEVDSGADVRKLFQQTRKELQNLGIYKQSVESEVRKIYRDPNMTDEGFADAVNAANKILAEKGIAPMRFGKVSREVMKRGHDADLDGADPQEHQDKTTEKTVD